MGKLFNNNREKLNKAKEVEVVAPVEEPTPAPAPKPVFVPEEVSLISKETKIEGNLTTKSILEIEGYVEGNIKCDNTIHLKETGKILGKIETKNIFADGEVNGEIIADKVEIGAKGRIMATIISDIFVVQEGGVFEGNKKVKKNDGKTNGLKTEEKNINKPSEKKEENNNK